MAHRILKLDSEAFDLAADIHIETLVDEGAFPDINGRSGHMFQLNGNELKILEHGDEDDMFPELSYNLGNVSIHAFFDQADYANLVAHIQANCDAPAAQQNGGRRRTRKRRASHRRKTAGRRK
jgi:prophage maintenance system killer protein